MIKRISAETAMKHAYFDALGPAVKLLPDSKLTADVDRFSVAYFSLFTTCCKLLLLQPTTAV